MEKSRIAALVDGIFAVAMTLLVLDLKLPEASKSATMLRYGGSRDLYPTPLRAMNDDYPKATAEEIRAMTNAEFSAHMEKLCKAKGIEFVRNTGKRRGETWTGTWQDNNDENLSG